MITLLIADGLGHGEEAECAAKAAIGYVAQQLGEPLRHVFAGCDRAIRHTRGVAMGIAVVDLNAETLTFAGIGNTRMRVFGEHHRQLCCNFGIVGGGYQALVPEKVPFGSDDVAVLYTDGLPEQLDHFGHGDFIHEDVQGLAEALLRDWAHGKDDAGVLVFRS